MQQKVFFFSLRHFSLQNNNQIALTSWMWKTSLITQGKVVYFSWGDIEACLCSNLIIRDISNFFKRYKVHRSNNRKFFEIDIYRNETPNKQIHYPHGFPKSRDRLPLGSHEMSS